MTISTASCYVLLEGDGSTVAFPFSFKCFDDSDLYIIVDDGDTADEQTITTDYTVSLNSDQDASPGGTVTFVAAPGDGDEVYIASNIDALQETSLRNATTFRAAIIESWMDRMTLVIQQVKADVARCVKMGATASDQSIVEIVDAGSAIITSYMQGLLATVGSASAFRTAISALSSASGAVLTANIADDAVTSAKIASSAVTVTELADDALANSASGRLKMSNGFLSANAAGRAKMEDGYLSADATGRAKMADGFVTADKMASAIPFKKSYTTGDFSIASVNSISSSYSHGLGVRPSIVVLQLVCITGSAGWTAGDVIDVAGNSDLENCYGYETTSTYIKLKVYSGAISGGLITVNDKGAGTVSTVDKTYWKLRAVVYA